MDAEVAAGAAPAVVANPTHPTANDLGNQSDEEFAKSIGLNEVFADADAEQAKHDAVIEASRAATKAPKGEPAPAKDVAKPADAATQTEYWQDQAGKWHRPNGEYADADESEAASQVAGVAAPAAAPDGQSAAKDAPAAPAPKGDAPKRDYTIASDDGTPEEEIPNLTFKFTADGRERIATADDLVRVAKMGYYNERREAEVIQARHALSQAQQEKAQYESAMRLRDEMLESWLREGGEDGYVEAARRYRIQRTPENQRAADLEQREAILRQQQDKTVHDAAIGYIQQAITPRYEALLARYPEVSPEEAQQMLTRMVAPLAVNGVVPNQRLQEVLNIIDRELAPWIEDRHTSRAARLQQVEARAQRKVDAAQIRAQAARNRTARASMPQGTAGRPSFGAQITPKGKYLTAEESAEAAILSIGGLKEEG